MAITIKTIPVLSGKVAESFIAKADLNYKINKGSIDFSKEVAKAKDILAKSKLK